MTNALEPHSGMGLKDRDEEKLSSGQKLGQNTSFA